MLQTCHAYLAENLDLTEVLQHLLSEGVVTTSDAEAIKAEKGAFKQNCYLLDLMQSKSFSQIEGFINCLLNTNQTSLAKRIDPNGTEYMSDKVNNFIILINYLKVRDMYIHVFSPLQLFAVNH